MIDPHSNHAHPQSYGAVEPAIFASQKGIRAVQWSFLGLLATALFQLVIVFFSGSVALLSDTLHNIGDAATSFPLWVAFRLSRWNPTKRFTYGFGRVEDLAGIAIVVAILLSGIMAGYESLQRLFQPRPIEYLWAVMFASIVGLLGNEAVAVFRIKVGKEIGSAALVADGYHARVDGLASLAVFFGALGVWLGYPIADPVTGLVITAVIGRLVWESGKSVFTRLLDGVDPQVVDEIQEAVSHAEGVQEATDVRVRWLGHRLHAEVNVAVSPELSVEKGHEIAMQVRHELLHRLPYLANATIHVDPVGVSGETHHRIVEHVHSDLPAHRHS
jgi:cation diffusion facilitator family transporter